MVAGLHRRTPQVMQVAPLALHAFTPQRARLSAVTSSCGALREPRRRRERRLRELPFGHAGDAPANSSRREATCQEWWSAASSSSSSSSSAHQAASRTRSPAATPDSPPCRPSLPVLQPCAPPCSRRQQTGCLRRPTPTATRARPRAPSTARWPAWTCASAPSSTHGCGRRGNRFSYPSSVSGRSRPPTFGGHFARENFQCVAAYVHSRRRPRVRVGDG